MESDTSQIDPMESVPLEKRMWIKPERPMLRKISFRSPEIYWPALLFAVCEFSIFRILIPLPIQLRDSLLIPLMAVAVFLAAHFYWNVRAVLALNELQWDGEVEPYWQHRVEDISIGSPVEKLLVINRNVIFHGQNGLYAAVIFLIKALSVCLNHVQIR